MLLLSILPSSLQIAPFLFYLAPSPSFTPTLSPLALGAVGIVGA